MKPWTDLATARAEDGGLLSLHSRDGELVIRVDGHELMSNRRHASEERLAELGCTQLGTPKPRVLIGGLGMGFTLMAALAVVPKGSEVVVAEISPAVVEWNRTFFGEAQATALRDPMTKVHVGDVGALVREKAAAFDAILLDVDNSPHAMTRPANGALYAPEGLAIAKRALRPRGCFAVWSCSQHPDFAKRLERAGFEVEVHGVRARGRKGGAAHTIYLGRLPR